MTTGSDFERLESHLQGSWLFRSADAIASVSIVAAEQSMAGAWLRRARSRWTATPAVERLRAAALFVTAAALGHPILLPIVPAHVAPALPVSFWVLVGATAVVVALLADGIVASWNSSIVRRLVRE